MNIFINYLSNYPPHEMSFFITFIHFKMLICMNIKLLESSISSNKLSKFLKKSPPSIHIFIES